MKGVFTAKNPENIEFELTITMTLKQWQELQSQLSEKWPSWQISAFINSMVSQARKIYFPEEDEQQ